MGGGQMARAAAKKSGKYTEEQCREAFSALERDGFVKDSIDIGAGQA